MNELLIELFFDFGSIDREFESYLDFHNISEEYLNNRDKELDQEMEDKFSRAPTEAYGEICEDRGLADLDESRYKSIHRASLVVIIFGFFEYQLNKLCKFLAQNIESKINFKKDLSGQGFNRAYLYLEKIVCLNMQNMSQEVGFIRNTNRLRNRIIHNGSLLPSKGSNVKEEQKLNRFIVANSNLDRMNQEIFIYSGFIDELIQNLIFFFKATCKKIEALIINDHQS